MDAEHKKLITKGDQQQEKFRELRDEVNWTVVALAKEQSKGAEAVKQLAEAAKEGMELQLEQYAEMEHATMVVNKVQTTYQTQIMHYKSQERQPRASLKI